MPITKLRGPNKKMAEVKTCFSPPKLFFNFFFFNISNDASEDQLIFQYI